MNPLMLWLFFTLDKVISTFNVVMGLSITALVIMFLVWIITGCTNCTNQYGYVVSEEFVNWTNSYSKFMKKWIILCITLLSVTSVGLMLLPNTKEAVAIVVIPKVLDYAKNNEAMMKIPNNVVNMANKFMEKKISDWSVSIGKDIPETDTTKDTTRVITTSLDSQLVKAENLLQELKDAKNKVDKVLQ